MKTLKELLKDPRFSLGSFVMLVLLVLSVLSYASPHDPLEWRVVPRDLPPSWEHPLGTSSMGQDVFWQLTFAARNSLVIAAFGAVLSRVIALTVGLLAGYRGGSTDRLLMFVSDGFMVIPLFLILVLLAMLMREHMTIATMAVLFGVVGWPWDTRVIRSQILSLREREFTFTAVMSGTRTIELIFKEYTPFVIPLVLATFINHMAFVVGMEITLAVIGLTDLSIPTLGSMLRWALSYEAILLGLWWWILTPIMLSVALFVALYMVSVSVSQYLDPRARIQRVGVR